MSDKNLIYILLMSLQNSFDQPIAYYPKENVFVLVGQTDDNGQTPLYPLTADGKRIIWTSSTDSLIFPPQPPKQLGSPEFFKQNQATTNVRPTSDQAAASQMTNPQSDKHQRRFKGQPRTRQQIITYYRLVDLSQFAAKGYVRDLAKEIFDLTVKTLHTSNQRVIDEVLQLYDRALHLVENPNHNDLNQLRKIQSRLQTIYNRQQSANHNREEYKRRQSVRRKVLVLSILAVVFTALLSYAFYNFRQVQKSSTPAVQVITLTPQTVEQAIDQYEAQHSVRVWQWRRSKIHSHLDGKQMTPQAFQRTLDSLITKAWH